MPAVFGAPEYVVITRLSSVAAGGITNVSFVFHVCLAAYTENRSSLWLSHPVVSGIVSVLFQKQSTSPDFAIGVTAYAESPHILLSGLSSLITQSENPDPDVHTYYINEYRLSETNGRIYGENQINGWNMNSREIWYNLPSRFPKNTYDLITQPSHFFVFSRSLLGGYHDIS